MDLEQKLMAYKKMAQIELQEERIQEAVIRAKKAFLASEQERMLSYREFLWIQWKVIQKRWWLLQLLLLSMLWAVLVLVYDDRYIQRSLGVIATLFVILMIPELWKNRSCQCMEIEASSYYSLKQIYAARILLFGIADVFLITVFCTAAPAEFHFGFIELMIQFLFPLTVTACICFGTLSSKYAFSETIAVALCIIWSAVWLLIILNESVYEMITFPIWLFLMGTAFIYLVVAIYRTLECCNRYWEGVS